MHGGQVVCQISTRTTLPWFLRTTSMSWSYLQTLTSPSALLFWPRPDGPARNSTLSPADHAIMRIVISSRAGSVSDGPYASVWPPAAGAVADASGSHMQGPSLTLPARIHHPTRNRRFGTACL